MAAQNEKGYGILSKAIATGSDYSDVIKTFNKDRVAIQVISVGASTGTYTLEASLDGDNWETVASSSQAFIANGGYLWELTIACSPQYRLKVAATDGTGVAATGTITGSVGELDFAADATGAAGNKISVVLVGGGTAGAETVDVVTADGVSTITVTIESATSTAANIKTALDGDAGAAALIDTTVSIAGVMEADSVTLSGGVDAASTFKARAYTK